jgi:AmmeMemoRadiSam system protein A
MHYAELENEDRTLLLQIARASIVHGLERGGPLEDSALDETMCLTPALTEPRATFVTLQQSGALRGCIGSLEVKFPLAADVARNAFNAAFVDPRFMPLAAQELRAVRVEITVLSPHTQLHVGSEAQLLAELDPGVDGLVLECRGRRATFLPQVWQQLPDAEQFVSQLKLKARIPADYWSDDIKAHRYGAESFAES